jgi:integrase
MVCWSLVETRAYRPARNIFAGLRAWPKTLGDFAFSDARLAATWLLPSCLAEYYCKTGFLVDRQGLRGADVNRHQYCRQFDPVCPVVPLGLCGPGHRRLSPHIYTAAEVTALLVASRELKPDGLHPLTYVTLFGLLAATGMRLSEALRLERKDLNLDQPSLTVRETKFKKSRLVPIHVSTAKALAVYQKATLATPRHPGVETVLLTAEGLPIPNRTIHNTFDRLRRRLGWVARGGHAQPRIHDLRHTFICQALLRGQQDNQIDHVADAISTYVGHAKVSHTYWYISATPELMSGASQRFSRFSSGDHQ